MLEDREELREDVGGRSIQIGEQGGGARTIQPARGTEGKGSEKEGTLQASPFIAGKKLLVGQK